ncbi:MAG: hypothetical protein ACRDTT_07790 [Pseudonocardiaceae bacterium]
METDSPAVERVIGREQVSLTEAVQRLITYGDFAYRAIKQDGVVVGMRGEDGTEREVVLV